MTARRWPVPLPRMPVKPRRDVRVEDSWLFKINPQRAMEIERKKERSK